MSFRLHLNYIWCVWKRILNFLKWYTFLRGPLMRSMQRDTLWDLVCSSPQSFLFSLFIPRVVDTLNVCWETLDDHREKDSPRVQTLGTLETPTKLVSSSALLDVCVYDAITMNHVTILEYSTDTSLYLLVINCTYDTNLVDYIPEKNHMLIDFFKFIFR